MSVVSLRFREDQVRDMVEPRGDVAGLPAVQFSGYVRRRVSSMMFEEIDCTFVVSSEVTISPEGAETLELAFRGRLRLVEQAPGFQRIEVWRDLSHPGVFQMVSWWDDADSFRGYMRSTEHRMSHARIPTEPEKPRGSGVRRYALLPDA